MADIDEWQTDMQLKPMRVGGIQLFTSGLNDEERNNHRSRLNLECR